MKRTLNLGKVGLLLTVVAFLALADLQAVGPREDDGGGGHAEVSAGGIDYELDGTIGQPMVGLGPAGSSELCSGFWCREAVLYVGYPEEVYLPGILKRE